MQQNQCAMCLEETAVGFCDICGHIGEYCLRIHKRAKIFETHIINAYTDDGEIPTAIMVDITEEKCKQHPTERALFLCKIHDSMVCGRCLHFEHIPCAKEVVDLVHEGAKIDCDTVNTMKLAFTELKAEILLLKDETEDSKKSYKDNADKCVQECMELGIKLKQRVDEVTSGITDGITMKKDENLRIYSLIAKTCDEQTKWCADEENKIDGFVENNMAGYLFLMGRKFEKEISDARTSIKAIKHKHRLKGIDFKENQVILKCLFEDLEEICEQQEEVTGSDDGNAIDVAKSNTEINKTRLELTALLNQANLKQEFDKSEKTQTELRDELKRMKQDLYHSEKTRKQFEQELLRAKQDIEKSEKTIKQFEQELLKSKQEIGKSEKTRKQFEQDLLKAKQDIKKYEKTQKELRDELKRVKQELYHSEKERAVVQAQLSTLQDNIMWTQPTGTVGVNETTDELECFIIELVFTFPDGIQTTHHPSPGKPYKGGTFTGSLFYNSEGQLLCRMLKAAFRRGLMFILGKEGKIVPDGISLYDGYVHYGSRFGEFDDYVEYIRTLKTELAAKGITEADRDQTENLWGAFTVDGPRFLEASLRS